MGCIEGLLWKRKAGSRGPILSPGGLDTEGDGAIVSEPCVLTLWLQYLCHWGCLSQVGGG